MKRTPLMIFIFIFSILSTWGQSGKLFNTDNNLSSNLVTQVYQDSKGFIWIITRNGFNVYDGYSFTMTKKGMHNVPQFNTNYFNCISEDQQGYIVLGTNKGLLRYYGSKFENIPLYDGNNKAITTYVTSICKRKNGDLAIGTSGYGLFVLKKGERKCKQLKDSHKSMQYVKNMTEDHYGRLWVITENGKLLLLDNKGNTTRDIAGTQWLTSQAIKEGTNGTLYLATKGQGVFMKTARSTVFTRIEEIGNQPIQTLYISRNGRLFLGYDGEGIAVYNPITKSIVYNPFFSVQTNLEKSKVQNIIEDTQGNIWISMLQKGVFMQPQELNNFGYMGFRLGKYNIIGDNCVTSVFLDSKSNLWVGTDKDGIYKLSHDGHILLGHYATSFTVLSISEDHNGRIWIGTYNHGAGILDASGSYHQIDIEGLGNAGVFDIKCDKEGTMWLATMGAGLVRIDMTGKPTIYKTRNHSDSNNKANGIPNQYIAKIALSPDHQRLYVATSVGLACLDIKKDCWTSAFGGTNVVCKDKFSHSVFVDSQKRIWYGTEDGVYLYNWSGKLVKHYTTTDGLTDNGITCIAEDYNGKIWLGSTCGLNKLDLKNYKITKFFVESGIQSNEFSDGAVCTSANKHIIIMGGTGGFNWFQADKVKQHPWKANVFISGFLLGNEHVAPGMESGSYTITENWVNSSKEFNLSHEDNSFTLQLSTLTYNNVEQISYAYSINGEEWRMVQPGVNELAFSHMPAGKYKFRVKAICNGYETPIREFTINVHPVWYASFWAKLIYALLFIGLCIAYVEHRKRKEEDRLTLQKHIHAEEMGEAKLKFFMNISHEIRTPLTLILTPLLSLIKEDKDVRRQGIYDIMRKNSERILHLINQMMDLRKIDKGQMVMRMSETNMVAFIDDEYQLFHQQALAKNINFQYVHDCEELPVWIDRNNFDKVLMNVLSNAFKFTPTGGKIKITLTHSEHHAYISIKDSGKGIDKDKLETIFQRFYQSPTSSTDRNIGTGIGLDLTRSLVELHYGTIVARNNEGGDDADFQQGSEFIVTLPLGNEHLKKEEIVKESEEKEAEEKEKNEIAELQNDDVLDDNSSNDSSETDTGKSSKKPATQDKFSKTKSTLAVVEDDEEIQAYLKAQLGEDFNILAYPNGKVALQGILTKQPDLVISDIMMPEMDGNTLCTKLKNNVNSNHIPVILLTAMSREEDQLEGLQTGADAYLMKPFNMDILRRTILNLLSVRRTLRNKFEGNEDQTSKIENVEMQSPDNALIDRIMSVINENLGDSDLSVDMIAQKVGISRVHLHRKMKELTNQTPHSFIRNVRLKQAAQLLRESKYNITDVMYRCGFSNAASFSTMFKNLYGQSPRDYMLEHRK